MKRMRSLRIVATLGPASSEPDTIAAMFDAGVDVFRLNMSHGDKDVVRRLHGIIRDVEESYRRPIGILADLQGPKLRVGTFSDGSEELRAGDRFRLDLDPAQGDRKRVCLPHREVYDAVAAGQTLLVNDGKIRLHVVDTGQDYIDCEIIEGGVISARKGVNVPDAELPLPALSAKDREDLECACELGVDWLALSFVQRREDVEEARRLADSRAAVMTKVEKPLAVERFDDILDASDGIMIARGDLGVELPIHKVPPIQKRLIRKCRAAAKPVIVATQMLESMIEASTPTRAEVSDVATAIYEGADAVMLSAESAVGKYPVQSVTTMQNVACSVESDLTYRQVIDASRRGERTTIPDSITLAAREIAETTEVKAICCFTHSGATARLVARERPGVPILVLTPFARIARRLSLLWGGHCVPTKSVGTFDTAVESAIETARAEGLAETGDNIVITAGVPFNVSGSTNIVQVATINTENEDDALNE
ncbi:MAG: pyruvate kinase [Rhodobacteraceae bacterium]|nr:pyruvate kinase [Paracoccaceae bacterium]